MDGDEFETKGIFNPNNQVHGAWDDADKARKVGGLQPLVPEEVEDNGDTVNRATYAYTEPLARLWGANSILGRPLIIYSENDDEETQPAGGVETQKVCCIIYEVEPKEDEE